MGQLALSDLKADVISALGRTPDDARLTRAANRALVEFGYAFQFPELQGFTQIPTVQGTYSYNLPADYRAMTDDGVRVSAPQQYANGLIIKESRTQFLRKDRFPTTGNQSIVGAYHIFQKKLWVRPAPNNVVLTMDLDYWKKVTPLSAPADKSPFEDDWDEIWFLGTLWRGHLFYGEHDRLINVFNLYLGQIRSRVMAEDLEEFPEGGISAIESQFANLRQ